MLFFIFLKHSFPWHHEILEAQHLKTMSVSPLVGVSELFDKGTIAL